MSETSQQDTTPTSSPNWGWTSSLDYSSNETVTFEPASGWTLTSINGVATNTFTAAAGTSYTVTATSDDTSDPSTSTSLSISSGGNIEDESPH